MTKKQLTFLVGSQNFGFATEESDKDWMTLVIPSINELCETDLLSKEKEVLEGENKGLHKVKDIRLLPNMLWKSNFDVIQILYAEEFNFGVEFLSLYTYMRENREKLATMNLPRLYKSVLGTSKNRMKSGRNKDYCHVIFQCSVLSGIQDGDSFTEAWNKSREFDWKFIREDINYARLLANCHLSVIDKDITKTWFAQQETNNEVLNELKTMLGKEVVRCTNEH